MSTPTVYDDPGSWSSDGKVNISSPGFDPARFDMPYGPSTPNHQQITGLVAGRRLYVHTRSRIYYLRRNKLRLWRIL